MEILVIGSLAYDRIMDFPGKFSDHILPEKIHILNVCFTINGLRENYGGTAGNIAYTLSLHGERPLVIASAGRDFEPYRGWLQENHLSTELIQVVEDEFTASAYITTDQADNQITAFNPGAMKRETSFDITALPADDHLVIISPGNFSDMSQGALACKEKGTPFIFDPGQSLPAWSGKQLVEAIEGSAIFISNDYELEMTLKTTGLSLDRFLPLTGTLITTKGEKGSLIRFLENGRKQEIEIPAVPPQQVFDPTGAGDAYRAGLLKGLVLPDRDIVHAARLGSASAAYAVEVYGTQTFSFSKEAFNTRFRESFDRESY